MHTGQSDASTQSQSHTHAHSHTDVCSSTRIPPSMSSCAHGCAPPAHGKASMGCQRGSSPSKGTPGLGSVGPRQCGCPTVPAVQQGDHGCSGKWHPRGLSLACDRPCSALAVLSPLGVPGFAVSASARGWCGGEWWHTVLCPARVTRQHTHVHAHTRAFTFSAAPMLGGTRGVSHMCVCMCVCRTNAHVCARMLPCAGTHASPCVCVLGTHMAPLPRGCRHASYTGNMHEHTCTCMYTDPPTPPGGGAEGQAEVSPSRGFTRSSPACH